MYEIQELFLERKVEEIWAKFTAESDSTTLSDKAEFVATLEAKHNSQEKLCRERGIVCEGIGSCASRKRAFMVLKKKAAVEVEEVAKGATEAGHGHGRGRVKRKCETRTLSILISSSSSFYSHSHYPFSTEL
ncbi:hypothetical protein VNO78_18319 [Psophocarpus tetragonolobus]|uniref:Uncharacterized protein n=1 Tax=Psophocarpus tetragonolobus TaxID=3891 RepID=A0AAN9XLE0_PSOTE